MKNYEIINYINRFCANKEELDPINADLAYAILAHGYLYVRPGNSTDEFRMKIMNIIPTAVEESVKNYLEEGVCSWPFEEWIRISVSNYVLNVASEMFDVEYFEEQSVYLRPDEECGQGLLEEYLRQMDKEQLIDFEGFIDYYSAYYLVFTNSDTKHEIFKKYNEICRKVSPSIPGTDDVLKYIEFLQQYPDFDMFDYLNKEDIVKAISEEIIFDRSLAGHIARMFYYVNDVEFMEIYVELAGIYHRLFHKDIYAPDLFYETL